MWQEINLYNPNFIVVESYEEKSLPYDKAANNK